ncbi:MAG: type II secretion system F family protein [Candidatus Zixiibacteriota bacterium]
MLHQVIFAVFSAAFLSALAVYLILSDRVRRRNRRIRDRLEALTSEHAVEEEILYPILRDDKLSQIPTINRILSKFRFSQDLQRLIDQAGVPMKAGALVLGMLSLGGLTFLLVTNLLNHLPLSFVATFVVGGLPYFYVSRKRRKRKEEFESLLPEAIDLITNALKAGFSLESTLSMVAQEIPDPVGIEFAIAFEEQNLGASLSEALSNMGKRVESEDLGLFITALLIQKKTGGNLAEILEKIAKTIRERFRLRRDVRIFTAHGRLSGFILVLLPVIVVLAILATIPGYLEVLLVEKIGNYLLGAAIIMQIAGILVIRRIIRIRI